MKTKTLFFLLLVLFITTYTNAATLFDLNFNDGLPPSGWTQSGNAPWDFNSFYAQTKYDDAMGSWYKTQAGLTYSNDLEFGATLSAKDISNSTIFIGNGFDRPDSSKNENGCPADSNLNGYCVSVGGDISTVGIGVKFITSSSVDGTSTKITYPTYYVTGDLNVKAKRTSGTWEFFVDGVSYGTWVDTYNFDTNTFAFSTWKGNSGYTGDNKIDNFYFKNTPPPTNPHAITFNVYRKNTATNLSSISLDCNDDTYDASGFNAPFIIEFSEGTYDCDFSKTGYDTNTGYIVIADSNTTKTIYLEDTTAPTVGQTYATGFTISTTQIWGTGTISATAVDNGSDINSSGCQYTTNNGVSWLQADRNTTHCYKSGITIASATTYDFNMRARDNSNNLGTGTKTITYTADNVAPTLGTTQLTGVSTSGSYIKGTANISTTISDTLSGVDITQCTYTLNNGVSWLSADGNATHCYKNGITITNATTYDFNLRGKDLAGNQGTATKATTRYGDTNAPTTTITFTSSATVLAQDINLTCLDVGSGCKTIAYKIDSKDWNYIAAGSIVYGDTNAGYHTIYYYSSDNLDNNETQTSTTYAVQDLIFPTLNYTIPKTYGFGVDNNIPFTIQCIGGTSSKLYFDVNMNGTNIFHNFDNNGATDTNWITTTSPAPTFVFACTNQNGLATTASIQPFQILQFQLVNENTGALLTTYDIDNNFLIAKVYSIDGNFSYDFKANHIGDVNAVLPSKQLIFNFGYGDTQLTQINRVINGSVEVSTPMRICAPFFQQFYEQQFISYTPRIITLYNYAANCYEIQGQLSYLNSSNYGLTTYTTNVPMYLSTWVNGVKTFFSYIDGGVAQAYNLDVIALTRTIITYTPNLDGLGVVPLINPLTNLADLNTLMIQYISGDSNNTSTNIQIFDGTTLLYTQTFTDANSVNAFNLNWYYGGFPGITSATYFKIIVTAQNPGGVKTTIRTVNAAGNAPIINQTIGNITWYGNFPIMLSIVALIISSLFFFFAMSIASTGHTFGMFGILMILACIAIAAVAVQTWYVSLIIGFYILVLLVIIFSGKPRSTTFG